MPISISEAPTILFGCHRIWEAFLDLTTCRRYTFDGEGPIPWNLVQEWMDRDSILDLDDRAKFYRVIKKLDNFYLDFQSDEQKRKSNKGKGNAR